MCSKKHTSIKEKITTDKISENQYHKAFHQKNTY